MYDHSHPREYRLPLDEDFVARTTDKKVIEKHGLIGKGSLHFVNALSELVEEKNEELPEEEWQVLERTLKRLMIDYEHGEFYRYLIHTHGADAIKYNAWVHFSIDTAWEVCIRTFTDMPTSILEEYGVRHWTRRNGSIGEKGHRKIMEALSNRTDIYGANGGIPPNMVAGILFHNEVSDDE